SFLISCAQPMMITQPAILTPMNIEIESTQTVQPLQTITSTSAFNNFEILLSSIPDSQRLFSLIESPLCRLPCWWTITPGETDWNYAKRVLQLVGETPILYEKNKEYSSYDVIYYFPESIYFLNLRLHADKNIVDFIT